MSRAAWLCAAIAFTAPALADNFLNMQPGLWELKATKTVVDGVDNSAQMSDAAAKMQAAMANMTPERRAQMEAMMQQHGVNLSQSAGGPTLQICMSADMAKRNSFPVGKDGKCQPTWTQSGNTISFTYSCQNNGVSSSGKGTVTHTSDMLSIVSDGTNTSAAGTHTDHTEVQMHYLGADCGAIKPAGSGN
jgi:hypothetical protein